ncbi:MAG: OsmC family protein [Chlamydiales bacterium]
MGKTVNGVDVDALSSTCTAIKENPELAKSEFRIHNDWIEGGHSKIQVTGYYAAGEEQSHREVFRFDADEPPALLGHDFGANPVEHLLAALSSCMTSAIIYHAATKGIKIESLKSDIKGELDLQGFLDLSDQVPKGYKSIDATFYVKTDVSLEKIENFYHYSPVYNMLSKAVPINVTFKKS